MQANENQCSFANMMICVHRNRLVWMMQFDSCIPNSELFNGSCGLQFRLRLIRFIQQIDFCFISNLRRRHLLYTLHVTGARLTSVCVQDIVHMH